MDSSPPDFSVHGIFQARILVWVAMPFSRAYQPRGRTWVSCLAGRFFFYHLSHQGSLYWNGNLIRKHPCRNTQKNVRPTIWAGCDPVTLTHKINHHRSYCLKDTVSVREDEKFLETDTGIVAQQYDCSWQHWTVQLKIVKMVDFMLCISYNNLLITSTLVSL